MTGFCKIALCSGVSAQAMQPSTVPVLLQPSDSTIVRQFENWVAIIVKIIMTDHEVIQEGGGVTVAPAQYRNVPPPSRTPAALECRCSRPCRSALGRSPSGAARRRRRSKTSRL